ncbi:1,2-phenylacetyl-CoA epoxidase subunit PaaC [Nevskia sp.]|uniref:1,2-phenylacetyl-CoA epoxidase subunit PaaC n=1 Tax=Nevskia sp. TaxID=1929292 RepID=UPI0025FBA654|nr:1,2-phenylacetyl-CoA epoxidase subunit PaaC [Nevskia sp.]
MSAARHEYLLRLGDNALILSQRLGEWCGKGPALEEDMALTNVALDLLGQARLLLSLAAEAAGNGADEDSLAYHRDDREFRNVLLVEQPNGNYADTLARQFLFDAWSSLALRRLLTSSDAAIAAIAEKAVKEVSYHLRRSSDLMVRLGDGSERSHAMLQTAIDKVWPYSHELFIGDAVDAEMTAAGIGFDPASLQDEWLAYVREVFAEATLKLPAAGGWMPKGGKQGLHSEHLSKLLAEMQVLQRSHPGASW